MFYKSMCELNGQLSGLPWRGIESQPEESKCLTNPTFGISEGTLSVGFTRNKFEMCHTNLLSNNSVSDVTIKQTWQ